MDGKNEIPGNDFGSFSSRFFNIAQEFDKMQLSITSAGKSRRIFSREEEEEELDRLVSGGILSLLDENTEKGPVYALHRLNAIVDVFWPEISDSISKVFVFGFILTSVIFFSCSESLYEDENFKHRELAALVSSKVYYHLGSLDNALTYALGAGRLFDVNDKTEYVETIIGQLNTREFLVDW